MVVNQESDGSFRVTLADVYAEVRKCQDAIATMQPQTTTINDHESRIRSLEKWKYALPASLLIGAGGAAAGIASLFQKG